MRHDYTWGALGSRSISNRMTSPTLRRGAVRHHKWGRRRWTIEPPLDSRAARLSRYARRLDTPGWCSAIRRGATLASIARARFHSALRGTRHHSGLYPASTKGIGGASSRIVCSDFAGRPAQEFTYANQSVRVFSPDASAKCNYKGVQVSHDASPR